MTKLYILLASVEHAVSSATATGSEHPGVLEGLGETAHQVGLNWQHLISQSIVFLLVAYALKRFAFDPIFKVLDERREKIEASLNNAQKIKNELIEAENNRKEILRKANEQANSIVEEARKAATVQADRVTADAQAQSEQIIKNANEETTRAKERMLSDLKREVGRLVIDTTAKVAGKVLTPEDQRRLNDEASRQLATNN